MANTTFDVGALRWVREEMEASLARARDALEAYLREDKQDESFIQQCQQALHEVLGVLTMLEVRSGASLVAEMEVVCADIANGRLRDSDAAFEALMEAILSLPSYLEDLQSAHGESLASLQPLMDGLRTSRGAKPLKVEGEPTVDAEVRVVSRDVPAASEIAKKVRPGYQMALLKVMRAEDTALQLKALAGATVRVEQASRNESVYRFWWLCGGLIEVIADGSLELDMDTKKLLGQIDRQLKRLMDGGEEAWVEDVPDEFIESVRRLMLESQSSSERVQEIADYYHQLELAESTDDADVAQVSGVNNQLMETVASAVQEDLSRIKDGLDLFKRSESTNTSDLERLIDPLRTVGDTLELLGMGVLREIVLEKQAVIEGIISGKIHPTNRGLMELASALLYVESSLGTLVEEGQNAVTRGDDVLHSLREVKQGNVKDDTPEFEPLVNAMAGPDYRQVINAVISEAEADMARAKAAITDYFQDPENSGELEAVPGLFDQVRGGLLMLEMDRAAEYLQAVSLYLSIELINNQKAVSQSEIDFLADGISAIEYYLEAVGENRPNADAILDLAQSSLEGLGYPWPDNYAAQLVRPVDDAMVAESLPPLPIDDIELGVVPDLLSDNENTEEGEEDVESAAVEAVDSEVIDVALEFDGDLFDEPELAPLDGDQAEPEDTLNEREVDAVADISGISNTVSEDEDGMAAARMAESHQSEFDAILDGLAGLNVDTDTALPVDDSGNNQVSFPEVEGQDELELNDAFIDASGVEPPDFDDDTGVAGDEVSMELSGIPEEQKDLVSKDEPAEALIPDTQSSDGSLRDIDSVGLVDLSDGEDLVEMAFGDDSLTETTMSGSLSEDWLDGQVNARGGAESSSVPVEDAVVSPSARSSAETQAQADPETVALLNNPLAEDLDEEILEIFIEEATEELESIQQQLPIWRDDPNNSAATSSIRRSFHTLKGSGRLAGANLLGEFAWSHEHLLNRIIDGSVAVSDDVFALMEDTAFKALPQLVAQLEGGPKPTADLVHLMQSAEGLCKGVGYLPSAERLPGGAGDSESRDPKPASSVATVETVQSTDSVAVAEAGLPDEMDMDADFDAAIANYEVNTLDLSDAYSEQEGDDTDVRESLADHTVATELDGAPLSEAPASSVSGAVAASAGEAVEARIDPVLLGIFRDETLANIELVRTYSDAARIQGAGQISDEVMRPLHTLHGSAHMAEVAEIADLCGSFERYGRELARQNGVFQFVDLDLLIDVCDVIESMMPALADKTLPFPAIDGLIARIASRFSDRCSDDNGSVEKGISGAALVGAAAAALSPGSVADKSTEAMEAFSENESIENRPVSSMEEGYPPQGTEEEEGDTDSAALQTLSGDVDPDLLNIFIEEGEELLDDADHNLTAWKKDFSDFVPVAELQRDLHTLKGGARMSRIDSIADLSHAIESVFDAIVDGSLAIDNNKYIQIHRSFDRLVVMLGHLRNNKMPAEQAEMIAGLESLRLGEDATAVVTDTDAREDKQEDEQSTERVVTEGQPTPAREFSRDASQVTGRHDLVRVDSEHLSDLVNLAGEVSIYRSRLEQKVGGFQTNLSDLDHTIARLQEQLRQLEIETEAQILSRFDRVEDKKEDFDPLEFDRYSKLQHLAKGLMESASDVFSVKQALEENTRETETLLVQQARINTDLQEGLMHTRMVPFSTLVPRMSRLLRQVSHELGKNCHLVVEGGEGELDRNVLDRVTAPMEHLIRNAVFHGIEMPEERRKSGKPAQGTVTITLDRRGAEVVIEISDDGQGLNMDAVRSKAVQVGLLDDDYEISDFDLQQVILEPGFSTADSLSQISGRGVGMDVVNSEVKQLGGSLEIHSEPNRGTRFTLRLPFTLAISRALLGRVGHEVYAVPLASLDGVVRFGREELERVYSAETPLYDYGGHTYVFHYLGTLVDSGLPELPEPGSTLPVLLIQAGDSRVALQIDGLIGSREIVVKSLGPQLSTIPGLAGATILGDGRVIMILEVGALMRRESGTPMQRMQRAMAKADVKVVEDRPTLVMVVDDSVTMRKVASRLLERKGFEVVTANDGVDALASLHDRVPDVVLLDIEMPRMDGYELAGHMRNNVRFKEVPIIMITSRTGTKHRERADALGVNRYLGKPWQEAELLEHIRELTE